MKSLPSTTRDSLDSMSDFKGHNSISISGAHYYPHCVSFFYSLVCAYVCMYVCMYVCTIQDLKFMYICRRCIMYACMYVFISII